LRFNGDCHPPTFSRRPPSHLAIIRLDSSPPKIVARKWFKRTDVVYYIEHFLVSEIGDDLAEKIRILDFKEREELTYTNGKLRVRGPLG